MAFVGKKITDEYNVPVRMTVEVFRDRYDRKKVAQNFLRRFGNPRQNRAVLQGEADKTGRQSRLNYILNGALKRIDITRRVQMEQRFFQC
ncbi:MAG: hypothetical protein ACREFF_11420 [Candidatus Udaeobacter sp.]